MHLSPAHAQRCAVICDALAIPRCAGADFVRSACHHAALIHGGPQEERRHSLIAYLVYSAFLGRPPSAAEIRTLALRLRSHDCDEITDHFYRSQEYQQAESSGFTLVCPPSEALVLDVTHTAHYPHTSGIQRVVRSLSGALMSQPEKPFFVNLCSTSGRFVLLTEQDIADMVAPRQATSRPAARRPRLRKLLADAKASFKRLVGTRVARNASLAMARVKPIGRMCRQIGRNLRAATTRLATRTFRQSASAFGKPRHAGVFLWHQHFLIPELAANEYRIELLNLILSATPLRSTLILYDLIPLRHPEYFPTKSLSGYVLYLSLLRHVDAISCISAVVRDDLHALLPLVPRSKPQPRIDVHYLGADFRVAGEPARLLNGQEPPFVLCVGTIEPRKNQTRILEAMARAQLRGCRFTGVFVGNAGWLNGHFRDYLEHMKKAGCRILLFEHASDVDLEGLYNASTFTMYCSLTEGFGLPIIESVMRGKPCITSNVGSMKEVAEQLGGCLLVNPENVDDIADAIQRLVGEPHTLAALQQAADRATWTNWHDYARSLRQFCIAAPECTSSAPAGILSGPKRTSHPATSGKALA